VRQECADAGGSVEECDAKAAEFLSACVAACERPEPPDPCDFDCAAAAERLEARCVEEHGEEAAEECAARASEFLTQCLRRQEENCAVEALALTGAPVDFLRGEVNGDGNRDISDGVSLLNALFLGGPKAACPDAADANDDGRNDLSDAVAIFNSLFLGSGPLPPPAEAPGQDPTADELFCP
jgi:hypothetical protein